MLSSIQTNEEKKILMIKQLHNCLEHLNLSNISASVINDLKTIHPLKSSFYTILCSLPANNNNIECLVVQRIATAFLSEIF